MREAITNRIIAIIGEKYAPDDVGLDATTDFESLDFDSLVLVELAVILTREFGVQGGDDELAATATIGAAAGLVAGKTGAV
jgi:acyl carrier protein